MSTMADKHSKRTRRSFTEEFKACAVRLVLDAPSASPSRARGIFFAPHIPMLKEAHPRPKGPGLQKIGV